ncbi:MAG: hypothetical protein R2698_00355 [Microthrixaceae bacterium]
MEQKGEDDLIGSSGVEPSEHLASYTGTFEYGVDKAGRISIPPVYREHFKDLPGYLTLRHGRMALCDGRRWKRFLERSVEWTRNGDGSAGDRGAFDAYLALTQEVRVDSQGRFQIPPRFREHLGIDKAVTVVGLHDHLSISVPEVAPAADLDAAVTLLEELPFGRFLVS